MTYKVHIDTSYYRVSSVLVQKDHSIAFESRKSNHAEQMYSTHKEEMVLVLHYIQMEIKFVIPTLCSSEITVELFYKFFVKNFKVPLDILSDRYGQFTCYFWTSK